MTKRKCKPGFIEWDMFGWLFRLPNGTAARGKDGRQPRYFKTPREAWAWVKKQETFIGGSLYGEPTTWERCL